MVYYTIKTCPQREWYVRDFLVPSLLEQGIQASQITVFNDTEKVGNLETCMRAFKQTKGSADDFTWYLQDDVIVCGDFKKRSEEPYDTLVCGFMSSKIDKEIREGRVDTYYMCYSFPCVGMPNWLANKCAVWFYTFASKNSQYRPYITSKRMDDTVFWFFMQDYSGVNEVVNLVPNLVDHIDYLIGGSVTNPERTRKMLTSDYFEYPELVQQLKEKLCK